VNNVVRVDVERPTKHDLRFPESKVDANVDLDPGQHGVVEHELLAATGQFPDQEHLAHLPLLLSTSMVVHAVEATDSTVDARCLEE